MGAGAAGLEPATCGFGDHCPSAWASPLRTCRSTGRHDQNPDRGIQPRQTDPPSRTGLAQQCDLAAGIEPARTARAVLGAPTRTRTPDLMIRSHLLYPLSYEGASMPHPQRVTADTTSLDRESNPRPSPYQGDALPLCYQGGTWTHGDLSPEPPACKTGALPVEL